MKHEGFKTYTDRELLEETLLSIHAAQTELRTLRLRIDWLDKRDRKEATDLRAFMAWHKEDANLSRRAHSATIQQAVLGAALLVIWALYPQPKWMPDWAHWCAFAVLVWYQVWPHKYLERANTAVEKHAESEPSWGDLPE